MATSPPLKRLRDLPGVMALERRAQLDRSLAAESARSREDAFDEVSVALFGITADQAMEEWEWGEDDILNPHTALSENDLAAMFHRLGWDVTDEYGRPLLVMKHFDRQLALVLAGEIELKSGREPEAWGDELAAEAKVWKPGRR
jgi:hypothetical protein